MSTNDRFTMRAMGKASMAASRHHDPYHQDAHVEHEEEDHSASSYASNDAPMPVKGAERTIQYISRCVVCAARGPVMTIHSQTTAVPSCPGAAWRQLWSGYSFLMVIF